MVDATSAPAWRLVAASVSGPHHLAQARENEDAMSCRPLGAGFVAAIADGAGSRGRSATGARLAVEAACDAAARTFARPPATLAAARAAGSRFRWACLQLFDQRMVAVAGATAADRCDYATTLLALAAQPPYYAYLSVGDGFLVVHRRGRGPRLLVAPTDDGPADATTFLTTDRDRRTVHDGLIADADLDAVALCTDGLAEALLAVDLDPGRPRRYLAPAAFAGYFRHFADPSTPAAELSRQLQSDAFAETSGDDKTIIVAVRR